MAERRPDLAREHRLHDRFRGPPRASPVRFQVSRPADRTSRGWARGVPLAECRFPGPATRRLGRLRRESERSTAPGTARPRRPLVVVVVVVVVAATPNYLRQASQNLGKYSLTYLGGPTSTSADVSVPRPRTHDDRTAGSSPDHLITHTLTQLLTYFTCTTAAGRRVAACARHPCSTLRQF